MAKQTKRTTGPRLGLLISEERDRSWRDYYHVRATVVVIDPTADEMRRIDQGERLSIPYERVRNCSDERIGGLLLNNLRVDSQGCGDDETRHLYGFDCRYHDVYTIDRTTAEAMGKTLRAIDTRLDKLAAKYGAPATFGQYLARVAEAIGATAMVTRESGSSSSYSENEYRVRDIRDGIYHVDGLVRTWVTERERTGAAGAAGVA